MLKSNHNYKLVIVIAISILSAYLFQLSPYIVTPALIAIIILATLIRNDNVPFYILLFLVPIDRFYLPFAYKLKYYQVALAAIYLLQIPMQSLKKELKINIGFNLLDLSIVLIYVGRIISLFISVDLNTSFKALLLYGLFLLLYFYIRIKINSISAMKMLKYSISFSAFYILFGYFEFILGKLGLVKLRIAENIYVYGGRPWSVFTEPDWFGGYLTFIIGLAFPFITATKNSLNRKYYIYIFYLAFIMSLIIVVRSSWLGLLIGLAVAFFIKTNIKLQLHKAIIKIIIISCIGIFLLSTLSFSHYESIKDRFISIFTNINHQEYDPAAQVRLNTYEVAKDYIILKPFYGYGVGAWEFLSQRHKYVNPSLSTNSIITTPIFEMGILGVLVYSLFIIALFKMLFDCILHSVTDEEVRYSIGIIIAVIGTLIVCIFNDIMLTGYYWTFLAIFNNFRESLKRTNAHTSCS